MRKLILNIMAAAAVTATFLGCSPPEESAPKATETMLTAPQEETEPAPLECPPGVVAMVDDRVITLEDAEKRARMTLKSKGFDVNSPDFESQLVKARKGAVDLLIESYVLQSLAPDTIEVATEEVEAELVEIMGRHKDRASFERSLAESGLTVEEFRGILEKDIRIRKVMGEEAQKGVPIPTKEEARRFYEVNTMVFGWPYRVRYDEIVWPIAPEVSDASREQARTAMENLAAEMQNNPQMFDKILAEAVAANWGYIGLQHPFKTVEKLDDETRKALENLVVDEVSNAIETPLGYSIVRIASTRESYESAEQEILQSLYEDAVARNLEDWKGRERKKRNIRICDLKYYEQGVVEEGVGEGGGESQ